MTAPLPPPFLLGCYPLCSVIVGSISEERANERASTTLAGHPAELQSSWPGSTDSSIIITTSTSNESMGLDNSISSTIVEPSVHV